jgi:hypothetical protein
MKVASGGPDGMTRVKASLGSWIVMRQLGSVVREPEPFGALLERGDLGLG